MDVHEAEIKEVAKAMSHGEQIAAVSAINSDVLWEELIKRYNSSLSLINKIEDELGMVNDNLHPLSVKFWQTATDNYNEIVGKCMKLSKLLKHGG